MLISDFYTNQEVFITGGSGFIGKALIEKILRSCPGVGKIFLLLRGKKGKSFDERLQDILNTSLYDRLRREQPQTISKVYAIEGDCAELGLGINAKDLEKIKNVSIIFHAAASVRFDDNLQYSLLLNTRGTFELLKIAETLKSLKVFMHVSTMYCNADKHVVEEKMYPAFADWRAAIKLAETESTETLNILFPKYSNNQPNTYTFSKSLSEQIISDHSHKLPLIVFRPSIVVSSIEEPVPGWTDNFNGLSGLIVACGTGLMRTMFAEADNICDYVNVDIVVRTMLIACYKMGTERPRLETGNHKLEVINCVNGALCPISIRKILEEGSLVFLKNPFEQMLWLPSSSATKYFLWYYIKFMMLQFMPAVLLDTAFKLANRKPL